jgi:hypothetical protein
MTRSICRATSAAATANSPTMIRCGAKSRAAQRDEASKLLLSDRQKTAEVLKHQLHQLGAIVVNAMPLSPDSPGLRFQILDNERDAMLRKLAEWDWTPTLISTGPRFCLDGTARPCSTYELRVDADREIIPAELGGQPEPKEVMEFRKALK